MPPCHASGLMFVSVPNEQCSPDPRGRTTQAMKDISVGAFSQIMVVHEGKKFD